ncbi:MAG: radical SAM protein [Chloroflexi bacterium]|nr:radical SAM protein [Chloroflexota bacterium]
MELATLRVRGQRLWRQAKMLPRYASYSLGQTRPWTTPNRMYLESTNVCNLGCIMCPTGRGEQTRPKGYMDFDLFQHIVDEVAPFVETTTLHIWGEPLLHPRLTDMIRVCAAKGIRAEISTNATLLTEEKTDALLGSGLGAIYLCLDGATRDTYEKIRRRADFDETTANIRHFLAERQRRGLRAPYASLQIIEMKPTAAEIRQFQDLWRGSGVDRVAVKPFDSWAGQVGDINELDPDHDKPRLQRWPCPNLWYHVHIYWDGSLVRCDRDFNLDGPLGNVGDGVMKAWRGPQMAELRRRHVQGDFAGVRPCETCSEWAWWKPGPFFAQGNRPAE